MRKIVLLLLCAGTAHARVFTDATDPALAGAAYTTFDGTVVSNEGDFPLAMGSGANAVVVHFTSAASYGVDCYMGACKISVWDPNPTKFTFDRPVGSIGGSMSCMANKVTITVTGSLGTESFSPCMNPFWGVADIGDITQVEMTAVNYYASFDNMYVGLPPSSPSSPSPTPSPSGNIDLTIQSKSLSSTLVQQLQSLTVEWTAQNLGAGDAAQVTVRDFLPAGATVNASTPMCDTDGSWSFSLAAGASQSLSLTMTTPAIDACKGHAGEPGADLAR